MHRFTLSLGLVLTLLPACSDSTSPSEVGADLSTSIGDGSSDSAHPYIGTGDADKIHAYPYVVKVSTSLGSCSGVLVSKRHVVTAAHCLCKPDSSGSLSDCSSTGKVAYYDSGDYTTPSATETFSRVTVNPKFSMKVSVSGGQKKVVLAQADMAVLELDKCLPATRLALLPAAAPSSGHEVIFVGFGGTSCGATTSGGRKHGLGRVDRVTWDTIELAPGAPGKTQVAPGDSGGPLLAMAAGNPTLIGVTSRGQCSTFTASRSTFTNAYSYRAFIAAAAKNTSCCIADCTIKGDTQCYSESSQQVCGDSAGCLQWGAATACASGEVCASTKCEACGKSLLPCCASKACDGSLVCVGGKCLACDPTKSCCTSSGTFVSAGKTHVSCSGECRACDGKGGCTDKKDGLACTGGACKQGKCVPFTCGNGIKEGAEECDGTDLDNKSCLTFGFTGGTLSCTTGCQFNKLSCCAGKAKQVCTGGDLYWYDSCSKKGPLAASCKGCGCAGSACFPCPKCGDGIKNGKDSCDGKDLGGATCVSLGKNGGVLACDAQCSHDTSGCTWAVSAGGSGSDPAFAVGLDTQGNVLVGGKFYGTATFGTTSLSTKAKIGTAYVARYSQSGVAQWAVALDSSEDAAVSGVTADHAGNVYATGWFEVDLTAGATKLLSVGTRDIFIVKVSPAGKVLWALAAGGTAGDGGKGITTDQVGNVYVTGSFSRTINFGSFQFNRSSHQTLFVAKISPSGTYTWVHTTQGNGDCHGHGITVDAAGNSFVTGILSGSMTVGTKTLTSAGGDDVLVMKLDSKGSEAWVATAGGASNDVGNGVVVNNSGEVFVAGSIQGKVAFGVQAHTVSGGSDAFAAKLDASGTWKWVAPLGGTGTDYGEGIAYAPNQGLRVTGVFTTQMTVAGTVLSTTNGSWGGFALYISETSVPMWAVGASSPQTIWPKGVAMDAAGTAYLAGNHKGDATFNKMKLKTAGGTDTFLWKLGPGGS